MTTETAMRSAVPPIASAVIPVTACIPRGITAITPKKSAPTKVIRVRIFPIYSDVVLPGRTPGTNAPLFCKFVAIESGSKVTAV